MCTNIFSNQITKNNSNQHKISANLRGRGEKRPKWYYRPWKVTKKNGQVVDDKGKGINNFITLYLLLFMKNIKGKTSREGEDERVTIVEPNFDVLLPCGGRELGKQARFYIDGEKDDYSVNVGSHLTGECMTCSTSSLMDRIHFPLLVEEDILKWAANVLFGPDILFFSVLKQAILCILHNDH